MTPAKGAVMREIGRQRFYFLLIRSGHLHSLFSRRQCFLGGRDLGLRHAIPGQRFIDLLLSHQVPVAP